MDVVLDAFSKFQLEFLPSEWVTTLWHDDFPENRELPDEYVLQTGDKDYYQLMINLIRVLNDWKEGDNSSNDVRPSSSNASSVSMNSWPSLVQYNYKSLIAVISTFIKNDTDLLKGEETRRLTFTASRIYFLFLSLPGALPCNIFNSFLYDQILKSFSILGIVNKSNPKRKIKSKTNKSKSKDNVDRNEEDGEVISEEDKEEMVKEFCRVLEDLSVCLSVFHLEEEPDSMSATILALVTLTQLETTSSNFFDYTPPRNSITFICLRSYLILEGLCQEEHGDKKHTILRIMRHMVNVLLIDEDNKMCFKENTKVKEHAIAFMVRVLRTFKEDSHPGLTYCVQQLCVKMPEKMEIREKSLPLIVKILHFLNYELFQSIVLWIISLCHAEAVKYRITGIHIVSRLLNAKERFDGSEDPEGLEESVPLEGEAPRSQRALDRLLLAATLSRCHDVAASVRSKSLSILAALLASKHKEVRVMFSEMFAPPLHNNGAQEDSHKGFFDFKTFFSQNSNSFANIALPNSPLPSGNTLLKFIEKLTKDDKVFVRKSSLHVLANILLMEEWWIRDRHIEMLLEESQDGSVLVRKLITQSLTELLLKYPSNGRLQEAWVRGVIPLIADNEIKSQEKVLEYVRQVLLDNLSDYSDTASPLSRLPWTLLRLISSFGKRSLFRFACRQWTIDKVIKPRMYQTLQSHIDTENNTPAWLLIVCFSEFEDVPNPGFIIDYFNRNIYEESLVDEYVAQMVMEAVHLNWRQVKNDLKIELCDKLRLSIEGFKTPLMLIARCMDVLHLSKQEHFQEWLEKLIHACESFLGRQIGVGCSGDVEERALCQHIFTLGEATQLRYGVISSETVNQLVNLIDPDFIESDAKWEGRVSETVKAVTVITIGKLSLQEHLLAKRMVPVIAAQLNSDAGTQVKINSMVALADLCIRFTSLVENYIGEMCLTLKDPELHVRTNSLKQLTQLIQEDYIKFKSPLIFYILITLRDRSPSIRQQTKAFILNNVLKKNPSIFSQCFIQSIFFFNDYEGHARCTKEGMGAREREVFSMSGSDCFNDRKHMYRFMLENMQDDQRFKISFKICIDILDQVVQGNIPLEKEGINVLKDTLFALACEEMRLVNMRSRDEEIPSTSEEGPPSARADGLMGACKKYFITQLVKRNYVDNLIPAITKLKHLLIAIKSPLVKDLMICLRELMKDFKNEINEMLSADPELASEVALDLKEVQDTATESEADLYNEVRDSIAQTVTSLSLGRSVRSSLLAVQEISKTPGRSPLGCSETSPKEAEGTERRRKKRTSKGVVDEDNSKTPESSPPGYSETSPKEAEVTERRRKKTSKAVVDQNNSKTPESSPPGCSETSPKETEGTERRRKKRTSKGVVDQDISKTPESSSPGCSETSPKVAEGTERRRKKTCKGVVDQDISKTPESSPPGCSETSPKEAEGTERRRKRRTGKGVVDQDISKTTESSLFFRDPGGGEGSTCSEDSAGSHSIRVKRFANLQ